MAELKFDTLSFREEENYLKVTLLRLFSTKTKKIQKLKAEAEKTCDVQVTWLPKEVYMPIVWVVFGNNVLIIIYEPDLIIMRIKYMMKTEILMKISNIEKTRILMKINNIMSKNSMKLTIILLIITNNELCNDDMWWHRHIHTARLLTNLTTLTSSAD